MLELSDYTIDLEWLLTWFPVQNQAKLDGQRTKAGFARHTLSDISAGGVYHTEEFPEVVKGIIRLTANDEGLFLLDLEAGLQTVRRTKSLIARPGGRFAFMINVVGSQNDREVAWTGLSFHGVITTGSRAIDHLEKLLSPLRR